ncbi:hypothetical protein [Streptomyces sp. DvalAA-19]|nr:hypothetical protein [Streptomyces sp. DvalAA-19]
MPNDVTNPSDGQPMRGSDFAERVGGAGVQAALHPAGRVLADDGEQA